MTAMHRLLPRPAPEPGRPFVNREIELQFIEEKLRSARQGDPMSMAVVCFWGAFGIGKSWLLGELERLYRRNGPQMHGSYSTLAARLDMNPERVPALWQGNKLAVKQVVRELWKQLARQIGTSVPDLSRLSAEECAREFVEQVTTGLAHAIPILMLDTMDIVVCDDEEAFFWLEEHLIERLALTDRVLFLFAGRGELRRWNRFQVRRRVDSYPLAAFDEQTSGKEIKANPDASKALYCHTFGHPLATEYLGRMLEEQGINLEKAGASEVEEALERSLVQTALKAVTQHVFDKVPELLAQLAQHASVLRWVNVEPLRYLAETLGLAGSSHGDAYYLDLIGQLQAHHLLYWDVDAANYGFDPALRHLLAHSLELDDAEQFQKVHLTAFEYHRGHLERHPQYLARYVPEAAYHHAIGVRRKPLLHRVPAFQSWWERFLSEQATQDAEPWSELIDALEEDTELRSVLPAEEYESLCSRVREHTIAAGQGLDREE
jgi:hypothetical protein